MTQALTSRIRAAWQGRISGCMLGKPVEMLSMREGFDALSSYLDGVHARPLRDYVPLDASNRLVARSRGCCRGQLQRSEPDDDVHYSVLALMMLEQFGAALSTVDVARMWLSHLPVASTFTAERAAYRILLEKGSEWFPEGAEPGFDIAECADNPYNEWIGAQIRADVYGWVCPGKPGLAARLAREDAQLSHRDDGIHGAVFIAAMGACIPASDSLGDAARSALAWIPATSRAADAVRLGQSLAGDPTGGAAVREHFGDLSPVHTLNNLALVVWALLTWPDDYSAAIGEVVAAGWDTDCNGATVGGLWGLQGKPVPAAWTDPWQGRVGVSLAGYSELDLEDLVARTVAVADRLASVT